MRQTPEQAAIRLRERLDEQTAKSATGCWLWTGTLDGKGYGTIGVKRSDGTWRTAKAHRVSYETHVGPIPDGLELDHLCRVRRCVRPDHLEPVTSQVNTLRGEGPAAAHAAKTHCVRGHEFTPANTKIRPGGRECLACARQTRRARDLAKLAGRDHACPSCPATFTAARFLKMHATKVHGELRDAGLIEDTGTTRLAPSGSPATVWRVTEEGRRTA